MTSTPKSVLREDRRGQAAVEALLVVMLLAILIFGGVELARGVAIRQALDSGTGAAVRALSLDPAGWNYARDLIQAGADQNVMGEEVAVSLRVLDAGGSAQSSAWLSGSPFGTGFLLEASAPFQADIPFLSEPLLTISVRHWGIVERYP